MLRSLQFKPPLARTIAPFDPAATSPTSPAQTVNNARVVAETAGCQLSSAFALEFMAAPNKMTAQTHSPKIGVAPDFIDVRHHKPCYPVWEEFVGRRVYGRTGKEKADCSAREQLADELTYREFNVNGLISTAEEWGWVKIHRIKPERAERINNDNLGYTVKLTFSKPVKGPISLGASGHFDLGFFVPVD